MALDPTVGGSTANSFLSRSEGDLFAVDHPFSSPWDNLTGAQKDSVLILATTLICSICYKGVATSETQSLCFPRVGLTTRNGYPLDNTIIPMDVKRATFELALILADRNILRDSDQVVEGVTKVKIGQIEFGFRDGEFKNSDVIPSRVKTLIPDQWFCEKEETQFFIETV